MSQGILSREQKVLLNLAAISISDNPNQLKLKKEDLKDIDWRKIVLESNSQTISLCAYDAVKYYKEYISKDTYQRWKNLALNIFKANFEVLHGQSIMVKILEQNNLKYEIIKGTASASYYPNPELRSFGDIDFLIDTKEQQAVEQALIESGYERWREKHISHVVFTKEKTHLEMHFAIVGLPDNEYRERVIEFLSPTIDNHLDKEQAFCTFKAPADMYHGAIILLHMQHHMLSEGIGLRHLCDWACFVKRTMNEAFWQDKLIPFFKEVKLYKYAAAMTKTCAKYLSIDCPEWAKDIDDELADQIIMDILTGGNFGNKDRVRAKSGTLIAQKGKKNKGFFMNGLYKVHKVVLTQYPIVKKIWLLYPFIFAWKIIKNICLMLVGKRTNLIKMIPEAEKRNKLYSQLEVYKSDK